MKFRMLFNNEDNLSQKGDVVELYSLEDIRNYPGVKDNEIIACEDIVKESTHNIVGFIRSKNYTDKHIAFIQAYEDEIEFIV